MHYLQCVPFIRVLITELSQNVPADAGFIRDETAEFGSTMKETLCITPEMLNSPTCN